jgi:O-antigen ligase
MAAARKNAAAKRSTRTAINAPNTSLAEQARTWLLFALVALLVARPLLPSEGVSWIGDGQPFNLLTICLAVAYFGLAVVEGGFFRRWNLADAAVAVLVVLCIGAALNGAQYGSPRPAMNMLFEWLSFGLIYFLARQLVRTPCETRALVVIMVALAAVMAAYGFHQVFVGLPATRAAYAANPDEALRAAGQWFPPGSPARQQFEDRLQSTEPFATFALTNSLAGYLAPWSMMALALFFGQFGLPKVDPADAMQASRATRLLQWVAPVGLAACGLAILACLVLTKSRSAYVAVAVGAVLYPWFDPELRRRWLGKRLLVAIAGVGLVLGAVAVKALDIHVLTETTKSLGYRLEYWRSTLVMIAHRPWLGVGPGNFQDFYTQFKLPSASEEIRDPHNFLLEVWATAGTFALVALGMVLFLFARRTWNPTGTPPDEPHGAKPQTTPPTANGSPRNAVAMMIGAAAGFLLAFLLGPSVRLVFSEAQFVGGLIVGAAVVVLAWPWVMRGTLSPRMPALGVLVLAIHLLAAGGIAYPGVADSWWLLLALAFNQTDRAAGTTLAQSGRWPVRSAAAGLVVACSAGVACYYLAYRPVVQCHAGLLRAMEAARSTDARIDLLVDAAEADPLSAEPWWLIAELEHARLLENPRQEDWTKRFVRATSRVLDLRPYSSSAWRQCARWYYELYSRDQTLDTANPARVCFQRAVALYPNLAELRGEYALALGAAGDMDEAQLQLDTARRLDELTPHADKKLSPQLLEQLKLLESSLEMRELPGNKAPAR